MQGSGTSHHVGDDFGHTWRSVDRYGGEGSEVSTDSISETVAAESSWGSAPTGSPCAGVEHMSVVP